MFLAVFRVSPMVKVTFCRQSCDLGITLRAGHASAALYSRYKVRSVGSQVVKTK
jgi:hypothetical protein